MKKNYLKLIYNAIVYHLFVRLARRDDVARSTGIPMVRYSWIVIYNTTLPCLFIISQVYPVRIQKLYLI